jgi:hypothetical protein
MLTAILAGVAFVVLFATWVILPSQLRKHHDKVGEETESEK